MEKNYLSKFKILCLLWFLEFNQHIDLHSWEMEYVQRYLLQNYLCQQNIGNNLKAQ